MDRLVLIDGFAVLHRAYHALPPLTSPNGQPVNAIYGFILMLIKVIEDLKPEYLCVAFDLPIPTFRHEAYIAYQATRKITDDDLKVQMDLIKEVMIGSGISACSASGFEADDVIGTLAKQNTERRIKNKGGADEVVIVTGDRDILQLVNDKVKIYMLTRGMTEGRIFDRTAVKEYLGVEPNQIVDFKALTGDASDNYPGVPGIGPKTANDLLREYGNLEKVYEAVDANLIKQTVMLKLKEGKESAALSRKLAQIATDAPIELDLEKAKIGHLSENEKFVAKLRELGFKSLIGRVKGSDRQDKDKEGGEQESLF